MDIQNPPHLLVAENWRRRAGTMVEYKDKVVVADRVVAFGLCNCSATHRANGQLVCVPDEYRPRCFECFKLMPLAFELHEFQALETAFNESA